MVHALRIGDKSTLNLFVSEQIKRDFALPADQACITGSGSFSVIDGKGFRDDYVIVRSFTLPGGYSPHDHRRRQYGGSAVHQVAHWLGLYRAYGIRSPYPNERYDDFLPSVEFGGSPEMHDESVRRQNCAFYFNATLPCFGSFANPAPE